MLWNPSASEVIRESDSSLILSQVYWMGLGAENFREKFIWFSSTWISLKPANETIHVNNRHSSESQIIWRTGFLKRIRQLHQMSGGEVLTPELTKSMGLIWIREQIPKDLYELAIVPIHMKDERLSFQNHRRHSLVRTASILLANIITWLFNDREIWTHEDQASFQSGSGWVDHTFTQQNS